MAKFRYTALSPANDMVKGIIEADSAPLARDLLRAQRLTVVKLNQDWASIEFGVRKVKMQELVVFTRQLSAMIDAGLPISRCFAVLHAQAESRALQKVIHQLLMSVEGGDSMSNAMARHPRTFPKMYVKLVHAGESSGKVVETLEEVATFLERHEEINARIKGAVVYPVAVGCITMGALLILYKFVIPNFEDMFLELESIPWLTGVNLKISHIVRDSPWHLAGGALSMFFGFRLALKNPVTRMMIDRWGLHLPVIGTVMRKAAIARFSRTLATLLKSGTNLMEAMALTADAVGNEVIRQTIRDARQSVAEGSSIAEPLKRSKVFPGMATSMIEVGQESGDLEHMLEKVADFYEKDVTRSIDAALELIKPATMVLLAVLVGGVLISVYIPMFDAMMSFGE
jgi:type IV pilus assembly protein PilC